MNGSLGWHRQGSCYLIREDNPFLDGFAEMRINNRIFWTDNIHTEIHYEAILSGFDSMAAERAIADRLPYKDPSFVRGGSDDNSFLDLSSNVEEQDNYILSHRLDRAFISISNSLGTLSMGRQALTWGNGFLFHPMDIFNPFSPSDITRDYKTGNDMVFVQKPFTGGKELQIVYVPRKNRKYDSLAWDASSLGGKLHLIKDLLEFDIMAAWHYGDYVIGTGSRGYLGNAAWRADVTYTSYKGNFSGRKKFLTVVANIDYSWVWMKKNFYGYLEIYYNGLGESRYGEALVNPSLYNRVSRGELFTLGKTYMDGHINLEVHPLWNIYLTLITNLRDPSGLGLLYSVIDLTQDSSLTIGVDFPWGGKSTEYGGYSIPGVSCILDKQRRIYTRWTWYF